MKNHYGTLLYFQTVHITTLGFLKNSVLGSLYFSYLPPCLADTLSRFFNSIFGLPWLFTANCISSVKSGLMLLSEWFYPLINVMFIPCLCVHFSFSALLMYFCFAEVNMQVLLWRLLSHQGQGCSFLHSIFQLWGLQNNDKNLLEEWQNLSYIGWQMFYEIGINYKPRRA